MHTFEDSEVLNPGDIFDLVDGSDIECPVDELVSYLVLSFNNACMQVAELGGEDRNYREVMARDIPAPGEFSKWGFRKNLSDRRGGYVRRVLGVMRESLVDLRTAETIPKANISWNNGSSMARDDAPFTIHQSLPDGLFRQVKYPFGRGALVRPILQHFDIDQLGALPPELVHRTEDGIAMSYDPRIHDTTLDSAGAQAIQQVAEQNGLLMFPDSYLGYPLFAQRRSDRAVSGIQGYLPAEDGEREKSFPDLASAHEAVMATHQAFLKRLLG